MTAPLVFVDSGVLLATFDARDAELQAAARTWVTWCWTQRTGRISTQVLNEFYNGALKMFGQKSANADANTDAASDPVTPAQVRTHVRRLRAWQPPHLDRYAVDGAWDVQDRYGLGYWDALIISSALQQGCSYLLSLELPTTLEADGLQIIHPLAIQPTDIESKK
jgi:predicted nucleic acid-binding protein